MNNQDYSENDFLKEIDKSKHSLLKEYEEGKNNASDTAFFNTYFIDNIIHPKQKQIWTGETTFDFLNAYYPSKSRLTKHTRLALLKQYCLNTGLEINEIANLIAEYDALTDVGRYVCDQGYFAISTREVYQQLYSKWRDENLELSRDFYKKVQKAIEEIFHTKNVRSFHDWSDDAGFIDYLFEYYPREEEDSKNPDNFPIPRFIVFRKNIGAQNAGIIIGRERKNEEELNFKYLFETYRILFLDGDNYFLNRDDTHFAFLFSVQMFLTDVEEIHSFLKYHLSYSFEKDVEQYKGFLEVISTKFKSELGVELISIIHRFSTTLSTEMKKPEITEPIVTNTISLRRQVLAFKYLFDSLPIQNDKIALAEFIKMVTGKEANQKTKDGNVYKYLKKPFPSTDKALTEDLQFIRPFFEKMGLSTIVEAINKEINSKE